MSESTWRDLGVRAVSGAILLPLGLLAIWAGGLVWALWLALMAGGMGAEWVGLCGQTVRGSAGGMLLPALLVLAVLSACFTSLAASVLVLGLGAGALVLVGRGTALWAGMVYIGPAALSLLALRNAPAGLRNVLFLMAVIWATDIAAYGVGRFVGGPRLAPQISPGKTWSGSGGGLMAGGLAGAAFGHEHPELAALLGFALSLVAQAGDLLESAIKRHFGAKDSGWIIPGHGGILDRLDGVLTAAPIALLWSLLRGGQNVLWH